VVINVLDELAACVSTAFFGNISNLSGMTSQKTTILIILAYIFFKLIHIVLTVSNKLLLFSH